MIEAMIDVNFKPAEMTTAVTTYYPIWTVLGVIAAIVIGSLVLWYKTRGAKNENTPSQ
jgi:hypothetical protein